MSDPPPAPFVVGVNRSGTTLLRLMLDAHPQLAIPGETHFLPALIRRWNALEAEAGSETRLREASTELILTHPRWPDLGIEPDALRAHLEATSPLTLADAARAVHVVHARERGKPRWGDKTPRYLRAMGRLKRALPEARFVHLIRDGRDVAVSLREVSWGTRDPREAAELWSDAIRAGRRDARRLAPGAYLEVSYEELVEHPERELRDVLAFVGLEWDEAVLSYPQAAGERLAPLLRDRVSRTGVVAVSAEQRERQHRRLDEPPRTDRVGRWRRELTRAERREFEAVAGDLLDELGY